MHDPTRLSAMLLTDGYCVVENLLPPDVIAKLAADLASRFDATPFCQGNFYGARTKRFGALLRRSRHAAALVQHKTILTIAETILNRWCDRIQLNLTQAVAIHPGALAQVPHRDQDLWGGDKAGRDYQLNVIWPIDPFTAANGATRLWSGSHRDDAINPLAADPIIAEMTPGSALLFLGSVIHGAGGNVSDAVRHAVIVGYCLGWLRTFENQYLVYPPEVAREFDPDLAALVGYAQHRPNLGNIEGQCPSVLLRGVPLDGLAAIDALLPEQAEAIAEHVAVQEAPHGGKLSRD